MFLLGGLKGAFRIDSKTGIIYVNQSLDREAVSSYTIYVRAANNITGQTSRQPPASHCACRDPSLVPVRINLIDINDNKPIFSYAVYNSCE